MEETSRYFSFVYIDENPEMKLIGYIDIKSENSTENFFEEEVTGLEKVA